MELKDTTVTLAVQNANLEGSTFTNVNLARAAFNDVKLEGASFSNLCLGRATFRDGNLSGVSIAECCLDGMTINGIPVEALLAAYEAGTAG